MTARRCWLITTAAFAAVIAGPLPIASSAFSRGTPFDLRLVDVTTASGVEFTHENSPTTQ